VSLSDPIEPDRTPVVLVYSLATGLDDRGHARDSAMVGGYALDAYQQEFLSNHCLALDARGVDISL